MKKIALSLFICLSLTSCTTVIPVHESESPEVLSGGKFRISTFSGSSPVIATQTDTKVNEAVLYPNSGYRLGFGLAEKLQLNMDVMSAGLSVGASYSLRYQWKGDTYFNAKKGNKSQATILRSFGSKGINTDLDENYNLYPYADLEASGLDISHLFGYRYTNWFGVYAGPKYLNGKLVAEYKNIEDGPVVARDKRNISGYGALVGLFFSFTGKNIGFDINLEYEGFSLPATFGNDHVWYNGWNLLFGVPFGF